MGFGEFFRDAHIRQVFVLKRIEGLWAGLVFSLYPTYQILITAWLGVRVPPGPPLS